MSRRKLLLIALSAQALVGLTVGIAYAGGGGGGQIYACYAKNDVLRVDPNGKVCGKHATSLVWNQTGPQGPTGPSGPTGASGPTGPTGSGASVPGLSVLVTADGGNVGGTVNAQFFPVGTSNNLANVEVESLVPPIPSGSLHALGIAARIYTQQMAGFSGNPITITFDLGDTATALACTVIPAAGSFAAADCSATGDVALAAGDLMDIKLTSPNDVGSLYVSLTLQSTTP